MPRSENFGDLTKEIPILDFVVRAKNLERLPAAAGSGKSGGAPHTSDKFWSDGSIKSELDLISRREETSSEWAPQLDRERRRRVALKREGAFPRLLLNEQKTAPDFQLFFILDLL